jgi:RNA polymerase sigma-70 factor (ECF subfamily)
MKVGSRLIVDVSTASEMALAVEIALPGTALTRNQTSLTILVERAAAGDARAFEEIMVHSQQRVMTMSWRILGNEADARDASQEVFLRVYKYLSRFHTDQDFFGWLYRITVNVCRDMLKKRQHQSNRFTPIENEADDFILQVPADQETAEQTLIQAQHHELICRAIGTLPYKERAAIVLRDMEGLSTDEVARALKSSSATVRSQVSSARKKIKDYCQQALRVK